jgi:UDP-N-acetylglucosamine--N-acetylmuramyl-(pentapeptide) pyrophosphoryl-undecaprenol N-acetylglucosamine transferase
VFIRVNPLDVAKIYAKTDIVVGRAGANTVSEIMTVKRPAILIPLSISFMDEQTRNARIAKKWGIAEIISQSNLSPEVLFKEIENLITHYSEIVNKVKSKDGPDKEASKKIVSLLSFYMK